MTTTDVGTAVIRCATTMLMVERRPIDEITEFLAAMATGPAWDGSPG